MIDSKKVRNRRPVRFGMLDEAIRDAQALAAAERSGKLHATGNWTLGQSLGHIAFWARAPFDGYPPTPRMPLPLRMLIPLMKNRFLNKGLPAGARIPGVPGGTFGMEPMATERGLSELQTAFDRLARTAPTEANPMLGALSHADWIKLSLRHAELHQSFFHPE